MQINQEDRICLIVNNQIQTNDQELVEAIHNTADEFDCTNATKISDYLHDPMHNVLPRLQNFFKKGFIDIIHD